MLAAGDTPETILEGYPWLEMEDIKACLVYARGTPHPDSDIDLVVILNKEGKSDSYRTMINHRMEILRRLRELKKKHPGKIQY